VALSIGGIAPLSGQALRSSGAAQFRGLS